MEAVFRLLENLPRMGLKDLFGDFLLPMGRQAVQNNGVRLRRLQHLIVQLVDACEDFLFLDLVLLLYKAFYYLYC